MIYEPLPIGKVCVVCENWFPRCQLVKNKPSSHGVQALCKECNRLRTLTWSNCNRERKRASNRTWSRNNPDRRKAERDRTKDKNRERANRWYAANKERAKARDKAFRKNNPELMRERAHNRKAKRKNVPGSFTKAELKAQYKRQHGKCYYCGKQVGDDWQPDHVIPLTRPGGSNYISNIVIACTACNQKKRNKLPHEWPEGGRLL